METKKIEGIIIQETNYSESSKILNIFTKELGVIGVISKGCRRLKSPLGGISRKLCYGDFIINYRNSGLSTLISADLKNDFRVLRSDIKKISYASYILELISQVVKQNNDSNLFDLLISSLVKINDSFNEEIITLIVELQSLKYLGIDVNVDCCSNCGTNSNIITLNVDKGGYICRECYDNEIIVTPKTIKVVRLLYYADISKITKLELNNITIKEISKFLEDYYEKYSGLYLKSKSFLNMIK